MSLSQSAVSSTVHLLWTVVGWSIEPASEAKAEARGKFGCLCGSGFCHRGANFFFSPTRFQSIHSTQENKVPRSTDTQPQKSSLYSKIS
jgi:hypothetical protein